MRRVAGGLLVAMACLFLLSRYQLGQGHGGWEWPRAFAEAAMVGALADWFAVTALFRHPLGLPIPHTAIIPAKKDQLADAMASFIRVHFLKAQVVQRRLRPVNFAGYVGAFLIDPGGNGAGGGAAGKVRLRQGTAGLLGDLLHSLAGEQLGTLAKTTLRGQLEKLDLAPLLGQLLSTAIEDGRHRPIIEAALRWAGMTLEDNEDLLRRMIHDRANAILRWTGLDENLSNGILDGLYRLLAECVVDPEHPLRARIEQALRQLADDLLHDPAMQAKVAGMKREILANPAMAAWFDALWLRARKGLLAMADNPDGTLSGGFGASLAELGQSLTQDQRLQFMVNRHARRFLAGVASRYGAGIVTLVSDTVKRWDTRTVTARIEGAVGRDLQFIRINGTLVGGLVGLLIHLVDQMI
ncbi:MAG: DUF445 domain-containing protein [Sphingomonadales bacterium]|nr:DUF445 domain-containing protein [Sphingomonadales bacterium]MDE2170049.1 DUF445 domain-containing protein [Sphingomonadales bacterium]